MSDPSRCVNCREQPVDPAWRPFCSERCKMADLGRWLSGDYRVADDRKTDDPDDEDVTDPTRHGRHADDH